MKNSSCYFENVDCDRFPCHAVEEGEPFNCLFCFCPLYRMENCGGNPTYTIGGIKDCSHCTFPHKAENYARIMEKLTSNV